VSHLSIFGGSIPEVSEEEEKESAEHIPGTGFKYELKMSSKYGGPPNRYQDLVSRNLTQGAGTQSLSKQWIEASLEEPKLISKVLIGSAAPHMSGGWYELFSMCFCVVNVFFVSCQWHVMTCGSAHMAP